MPDSEILDAPLPTFEDTPGPPADVQRPKKRAREGGARPIAGKNARRELPAAPEAEATLLASIELDPDELMPRVMESGIEPDSFFVPQHQIYFTAIQRLWETNQAIDGLSIHYEVERLGEAHNTGGLSEWNQIAGSTQTTVGADRCIKEVHSRWLLRKLIDQSTRIQEAAFNREDPAELLEQSKKIIEEIDARGLATKASVRAGHEFGLVANDDPSVLLGTNRYLSRGEGMVIVSSSGMGKSSMQVQAAICWALGKPFMGIQCNGVLRSLVVQSEDSDGDIAEVWQSVCACMELTDEERRLAGERVRIVTEKIHRGDRFLRALKKYLRQFPCDLLWLNPLQAYIEGDISKAEDAGRFLREGLNGINSAGLFGTILIHHTNKPPNAKERGDRHWHEEMYEMAGSAEVVNWARAIICLKPAPQEEWKFVMTLSKRGKRAGVVEEVDQGAGKRHEIITKIPVEHAEGTLTIGEHTIPKIFWLPSDKMPEMSEPKKAGKPSQFFEKEIVKEFPIGSENAAAIFSIFKKANASCGIGKTPFYDWRKYLIEKQIVFQTDDGKYYRLE